MALYLPPATRTHTHTHTRARAHTHTLTVRLRAQAPSSSVYVGSARRSMRRSDEWNGSPVGFASATSAHERWDSQVRGFALQEQPERPPTHVGCAGAPALRPSRTGFDSTPIPPPPPPFPACRAVLIAVKAGSSALPDILCVVQVCLEGEISRQSILHRCRAVPCRAVPCRTVPDFPRLLRTSRPPPRHASARLRQQCMAATACGSLSRGKTAAGDLIPWTMSQQFQDTVSRSHRRTTIQHTLQHNTTSCNTVSPCGSRSKAWSPTAAATF